MSKTIEYPVASFKKCLELSKSIYDLGESCSVATCAKAMGRNVSGGFHMIISTAVKYGLISHKKGSVTTTELYKEIEHAYTEEERAKLLQKSFLSMPLFEKIYTRFINKQLPIDQIENLLIREFSAPKNLSSRITKYFIDGARETEILTNDNFIKDINNSDNHYNNSDIEEVTSSNITRTPVLREPELENPDNQNQFKVNISGPGMNFTLVIREKSHFDLVAAMLATVKSNFEKDIEE